MMMKNYKSPQNEVYAYNADGSQDHVIPSNFIPITEEEAIALNEINAQKEFNSLTYAQKRAMAYPSINDYIDGVVKGDQAQIDKYIAECLAVKEKYPKP